MGRIPATVVLRKKDSVGTFGKANGDCDFKCSNASNRT